MSLLLKNKKIQQGLSFLILAILILFFGLPFVWGVKKIPPKVYFMGDSLAGAGIPNLKTEIKNKINELYEEKINLIYEGKRVGVKISELGFSISDKEMADKLVSSSGGDDFSFKKILFFWECLIFGYDVPVYYNFDVSLLEKKIQEKYKINLSPSADGTINIEGENIKIIPAKIGLGIDSLFLSSQVVELLKSNNVDRKKEIEIRIIDLEPGVSTETVEKMKEKIEKIVAYPYVLKAADYERKILKENILSWFKFVKKQNENLEVKPQGQNFEEITNISLSGKSFLESKNRYVLELEIDEAAIKNFLEIEIQNKIFREKKDGALGFENGEIKEVLASQSEINIDKDRAAKVAIESFKNNNYFIELPVVEVYPNISLAKIRELKINTLIAQGESDFTGSPTNRRHNIRVGASKFNGVIINKDEEFSFVTTLGPVDKSTGYLPELVIKKDKTIPEYGGGMCQVSSTAFRAAVKGGLKITERQNHAYPVQYYSPQGTDATVYIPKPDLKFLNNTPGPILIQTRMEGNLLFFDFFGNSDGRIVELEGPRVWDKKSDGSMKTEWIQKVFDKDKNLLFEKSFLSKYESPSKFPHPGDEKPPEEKKKKKKKN